jgi:hypothetical protein
MQKFQKLVVPHPFDDGKGPFFRKAKCQFPEKPAARKAPKKTQADSVFHELVGVSGDLEMKSLFKT